ncbi:hypothetical protein BJ508DRAFT_331410 [Ascobolus immersus RN42]|uniref:Uncharacterized protein n=1 Tax=Ascobolus immersus RN42 TaxID=1160509 RepID=A0A3N4HUE4_ASCIM|nr:hypothetical protein BJ508DRAFT_331410 [Ascobolus immersus RN42]
MDPETQLRKRIARLRSRQSDYTARWESLATRISVMHEGTGPRSALRLEMQKSQRQHLIGLTRPDFKTEPTALNIEDEENRLADLETNLALQRSALPILEKEMDALSFGRGPEEDAATGLFSLLKHHEDMRRRGLQEEAISAATSFMVAGGFMMDDAATFGPIPPLDMRMQRLSKKVADFNARRKEFQLIAVPKYDLLYPILKGQN